MCMPYVALQLCYVLFSFFSYNFDSKLFHNQRVYISRNSCLNIIWISNDKSKKVHSTLNVNKVINSATDWQSVVLGKYVICVSSSHINSAGHYKCLVGGTCKTIHLSSPNHVSVY